MNYKHIFYLTSDKLLDIEFLFLDLGAEKGWRAYVLSDMPFYKKLGFRKDKHFTFYWKK